MGIKVEVKFGGSSLADAEQFRRVRTNCHDGRGAQVHNSFCTREKAFQRSQDNGPAIPLP